MYKIWCKNWETYADIQKKINELLELYGCVLVHELLDLVNKKIGVSVNDIKLWNESPINYGWGDEINYINLINSDSIKQVTSSYHPQYEIIFPQPRNIATEDKKETLTRSDILDKAKDTICHDRNNQYGEPEQSFNLIARFWNNYILEKHKTFIDLTSEDVANLMVLFKVARNCTGKTKLDNYIDMAGYSAIGGELFGKNKINRTD